MGWLRAARPTDSRLAEVKAAGGRSIVELLDGVGSSSPDYPGSTFLSHVREGYEKNELVYACIEERVTSMAEAPLRVYDAGGRRGDTREDHPLRQLLANPNPLMTEFEMAEMLQLHLDLAGNAFWEVIADRAGRPAELWPLRPDLVRMKRSGNTVSYGYEMRGRTVGVDVLHFRLTAPVDGLVGTAPMRPALRATALDNEATDFVKTLLQNHAIPGVVVTMSDLESVLDEATTNRLKTKWKQSYGGSKRGEPAFLQAGMDVKTLGLSLKDLEFPDLRTISESRICMSFGVPPILVGAKVGLDRSTFANYKEARSSFWEETIMPLQRRVRDTISARLLPRFLGPGKPRVMLGHDLSGVLALRESEESRWTRATEAFRAGGLTLNDFRHEIGVPEVSGGNVFLVPSGVVATRDVSGVMSQVDGSTTAEPPAAEPAVGE
jgi:HK97 family phage portal protein